VLNLAQKFPEKYRIPDFYPKNEQHPTFFLVPELNLTLPNLFSRKKACKISGERHFRDLSGYDCSEPEPLLREIYENANIILITEIS
jgi:hypothetical protein